MGGFATAIGHGLETTAEKLTEPLEERIPASLSPSRIFDNAGDEGKFLKGLYEEHYLPERARQENILQLQAMKRAQQEAAMYKAQGKDYTPSIDTARIKAMAAKKAADYAFGANKQRAIALIESISKRNRAQAENVSNALALVLKDRVVPNNGMAPYSDLKMRLKKMGAIDGDSAPTYNPASPVERSIENLTYNALSPFIVIPHLATLANGIFGTDAITFAKGLTKAAYKAITAGVESDKALLATGVLNERHWRNIAEWNQFKATNRPKFTGSSTAHILYKFLHQPGFAPLRDYTLLSGAEIGRMTVEDAAAAFARNPSDKVRMWQLTQFGLDPQRVLANRGQLTEEDLSRAIYKFVNDHYFLDNALQRSQLLQSSNLGRMLGMYHSYVSRQAKLMANAIALGIGKQGTVRTVRNLLIAATLFPAMGEGIKLLQQTLRGQPAGDTLQEDMDNISGANGAVPALETWAEAMGHVGTWGVYNHIMRGALTHNLAAVLGGPIISTATNLGQDAATGINKTLNDEGDPSENFKPLERDMFFDLPYASTIGQLTAHRLVPTKKDEDEEDDPLLNFYHHLRGDDNDTSQDQNPQPEGK